MLPRPRSVFDDLPQPAGTGVTYDSSYMGSDKLSKIAIRIDQAIFMPDEPLTIKVVASYKELQCLVEKYTHEIRLNDAIFAKVQEKVHKRPDMQVGDYTIRTRLTLDPTDGQGTVDEILVQMTGKCKGHKAHEVHFIKLMGEPAERIPIFLM